MRGRKMENERKIERFTDWLATPEEERIIKTQKEFAESLGVDEHTLTRWKTKLAETGSEDEIAMFKNHLYRQAMKPGATAKHMELFARLKGLFDAPKEPDGQTRLTADDYAKDYFEARKWLIENGYFKNGHFV